MSARPTWKGLLKISMVTIPIKVYPATESADGVSFNQLHSVCQTRMQQRKWCQNCGREVQTSEIVKGFEFEKGRYVILSDAELDAVRPPSTRVIDLVQFADAATLDPIHIARSYYVQPDGPRSEGFAVMRTAMKGLVGVGALAIYGREYLVAVRPLADALLLHTLHHAAEIRPVPELDDEDGAGVVVAPSQVRLARQVIAAFRRPLDLATYTDTYQADLRAVIDAKIAGDEIVTPRPLEAPAVTSLRTALEQSLRAVTTRVSGPSRRASKPVPAKATLRRRAG